MLIKECDNFESKFMRVVDSFENLKRKTHTWKQASHAWKHMEQKDPTRSARTTAIMSAEAPDAAKARSQTIHTTYGRKCNRKRKGFNSPSTKIDNQTASKKRGRCLTRLNARNLSKENNYASPKKNDNFSSNPSTKILSNLTPMAKAESTPSTKYGSPSFEAYSDMETTSEIEPFELHSPLPSCGSSFSDESHEDKFSDGMNEQSILEDHTDMLEAIDYVAKHGPSIGDYSLDRWNILKKQHFLCSDPEQQGNWRTHYFLPLMNKDNKIPIRRLRVAYHEVKSGRKTQKQNSKCVTYLHLVTDIIRWKLRFLVAYARAIGLKISEPMLVHESWNQNIDVVCENIYDSVELETETDYLADTCV